MIKQSSFSLLIRLLPFFFMVFCCQWDGEHGCWGKISRWKRKGGGVGGQCMWGGVLSFWASSVVAGRWGEGTFVRNVGSKALSPSCLLPSLYFLSSFSFRVEIRCHCSCVRACVCASCLNPEVGEQRRLFWWLSADLSGWKCLTTVQLLLQAAGEGLKVLLKTDRKHILGHRLPRCSKRFQVKRRFAVTV